MNPSWSEETEALYRRARKGRLVAAPAGATLLDRAAIEDILPHRAPFLLVHRVVHLDLAGGFIVGRYPLSAARDVLGGHFPSFPVYPGVLHIEMIGQAAILLWLMQHQRGQRTSKVLLTTVLGANFLHPIRPEGRPEGGREGELGEIEVAVKTLDDDGLFTTAVGQCIWRDTVCSVAAASCLVDGEE